MNPALISIFEELLGRSQRGSTVSVVVPSNRGLNVSLISAISNEEPLFGKTYTGSINSEGFIKFMEELLNICDEYYDLENCIFIIDNAKIHHSNITKGFYNERGLNVLYLSPYSYMLNPIEFAFSKVKSIVRRELSESYNEDFGDLIKNAFFEFSGSDLLGYYGHIHRNCVKGLIREDFN
ncbi:hypothetical protein DMUE_4443 [Dictyocoela muelleri]|nr:hypothetical protein DMUE_4443 [Dictyocoela muelleri]